MQVLENLLTFTQFNQNDLIQGETINSPWVISPKINGDIPSLIKIIENNRELFLRIIHEHGAILLRGFACNAPTEFSEIIQALGLSIHLDYSFATPRHEIAKGIYTSTEVSPAFPIYPHNEMAFDTTRPALIAFYCNIEPEKYGETPIFNCQRAYQDLDQKTKETLLNNQFKFVRFQRKKLPKWFPLVSESWQRAFATSDKNKAEDFCRKKNWSYKWDKADNLYIEHVVPICVSHPVTNEAVLNLYDCSLYSIKHQFKSIMPRASLLNAIWLKLLCKLYCALNLRTLYLTFANDQPLLVEDEKNITQALWKNGIIFPWRKNDVLILDNFKYAHGRMNVVKPRRILTCLAGAHTVKGVKQF